MKPYAYNPRNVPTAFVEYATGRGVLVDTGAVFRTPITDRRRKTPAVSDLLAAAVAAGVERVYLTGPRPTPGWLLVATPGFTPAGHYLDADVPVGRFTSVAGKVELRRAAEWFGDGTYSPDSCRQAWQLLANVYRRGFGEKARLLSSPAGTGLDAWARLLPDGDVAQLDDDTAQLVRATSPQHRIELFTETEHRASCDGCRPLVPAGDAPAFHYLDGRLMYASLTRELGTVEGARKLTAAESHDLMTDPAGRFARVRYEVRFRVPAGWDRAGLLMEKCDNPGLSPDDPEARWHAPHVPGYVGQTWADAAEVALALAHGWEVRPLRGLLFGKGRPLDRWTERLVTMRERAEHPDASEEVRAMVRGAVRSMLLFGIGAFHSAGRNVTHVTDSPLTIPDDLTTPPQEQSPGLWVWRERVATSGRQRAFQHPEWSSQVWGRAHARLLDSPTGDPARKAGLLHLDPAHVLGVYGDALYLSVDPAWTDDGRLGRFRHKGAVLSPVPAPTTADARNRLRAQAERASS